MSGQQGPLLLLAALQQCGQHHFPAAAIHAIRRLVHLPQFRRYAARAGFEQRALWQIVRAIDRTGRIAVQMAAIAGKCN